MPNSVHSRMRTVVTWSLVLLGCGVIAVAAAQERVDGPFVLHEFFTGTFRAGAGVGGGDAKPPRDTVEVAQAGAPPALSSEAGAGEMVYGADGPLPDARIKEPYGDLNPFAGPNTLDANTDRVDSLTYFANFDPSVIPYKRVVAQNSVFRSPDGDYVVRRLGPPRPMQETGQLPIDAQVFWGTFMVQMDENRMQPIASVAPHQEVLEVVTEPPVRTQIMVDDAGNFMVRAAYTGPLRINLKVAVPSSYFTGEFQPASWDDIDRLGLAPLEPAILQAALKVRRELGLSRSQPPEQVLTELVSYFRNFEGRPFPDELRGDDLYISIAQNQIGVCRHRSLAFLITAQSFGFPTHYVYNEAHAFVEVKWPRVGWRRIDLGGAADELNAAANDDRTIHAPPDTLPRPERFVRDQERMVQNGLVPPTVDGVGPGDATQGSQGVGDGAAQDPLATGQTETSQAEAAPDLRRASTLVLRSVSAEVKRGGTLSLRGRLSSGDAGLPGREVEVHLGPPGTRQGSRATRLVTTTTGADGEIAADVVVPAGQPVGRWSLFLVFPGDEQHKGAFAE